MNCLYILVAPSAVGKSALLHQLKTECCSQGQPFWYAINKYSTRDCRGVDSSGIADDVVDIDNKTEDLQKARQKYDLLRCNDVSSVEAQIKYKSALDELIAKRFQYIESYCKDTGDEKKGIVYHLNTNLYGFNYKEISSCLERGNGVIICSDFDTIRTLKNNPIFGKQVRVVYIASSMDEKVLLQRYKGRIGENEQIFNINKESLGLVENYNNLILSAARLGFYEKIEETIPLLNETWNSMLKYYTTICNRKEKIRLLFNQYIENIAIIDHVILNFYDLEYMFKQMKNVIINNNCGQNSQTISAPVFMVCAAPSSGKGTLMEIVSDIGKIDGSLIQIPKYAKREAAPLTDRRDGMIPIGSDGKFEDYISPSDCIWNWIGHKTSDTQASVSVEKEYAVNIQYIRNNIKNGKAQIFISNFGEIEKARALFPNNLVVLYLHATHDTETRKHIQKKRELESRKKIRQIAQRDESLDLSDDDVTKRFLSDDNQELLKNTINTDLNEIKETHYRYVDCISQVNHVILNTGTQDDLILQMLKVLKIYKN